MSARPDSAAAHAAVVVIVAAEKSGQTMTADQYWEVYGACRDVSADPDDSLAVFDAVRAALEEARGPIASPDGTHGPFPGSRCVYCGANDLDVDLYALDARTCPPQWGCGAEHPDDNIAYCLLAPGHSTDHFYEWFEWPEAFDPAAAAEAGDPAFGWVPAEGPPLRRTLSWPVESGDET